MSGTRRASLLTELSEKQEAIKSLISAAQKRRLLALFDKV
jgi:hypothetical protein